MYNLILVDDECFTIDVFKEVINYKELGFNLVGTFYDGRSALEYIKTHSVDAVITDIIMPEFTGLDLLREIRTFNPDIEVILLSAHADFEFASFGIDHKIFKYVLKPLTLTSFSDMLKSLYTHLSKKKSTTSAITFQSYLNPSLQKALYEYIFKNSLITKKQLQDIMTESNFTYNLSSDYMTIVDMNLLELDSYLVQNNDFNSDTIIQAVKNLMCREDYLVCPLIYTFDSFKVFLIAKADNNDDFINILNDFTSSITYDLATIFNLQIDISPSKIFVDIHELANYNKTFSEAKQEATLLVNMIMEKADKFQILSKTDFIIREHKSHMVFMESFSYSIYQQIIKYVDLQKMREFNIYPSQIALPLELDEHNSPVYIQSLIEYLPQTIENLTKLVSDKNTQQPSTVQMAIDFIIQNYNSKISLSSVSNHVYCNPTYLSRLLKASVGVSFTNYLNEIRISKAEELLLNTTDSVYSIAKAVGYESTGYFYKKFKEKNNCSPDTYRQNKQKH